MLGAANNPAFAKKVGIKPSVAKKFVDADKGRSKAALKRMPERADGKGVKRLKHNPGRFAG